MDLKIYKAIKKYVSARPVRFHMPGHKGGKFLKLNERFDVTELNFIGNELAVREAEKDCAKILGADFLRFLTDGASSGIFSAIYAIKDQGKKLIINRTAHKSVFNALKIFNIEPIIVGEKFENGLPTIITDKEIDLALKENPDAIGVMLTYPDYYGRTFDLESISKTVKKQGKAVIIDNAHGNHYAYFDVGRYAGRFADIWIDGVHKTNFTFNQGAIVCSKQAYSEKLSQAVDIFSTTSPSYPILISIEYGIKYSYYKARKEFSRLKEKIKKIKQSLKELNFITIDNSDCFKLTIDIGGSGYNVKNANALFEKHDIFAELVSHRHILFMFSTATKNKELNKIIKIIKKLKEKQVLLSEEMDIPKREISYLEAVNQEYELTPLEKSAGLIACENFGIFPPCYPIVVAGEVINENSISRILGKETFGIYKGMVKTLKAK